MNKIEFLERLEQLLADVPYTERREALNYYTEYFADADKDEDEVIKTLGSPEEVAHNIREELAGKELVESGAVDPKDTERECDQKIGDGGKEKKGLEGWQIALMILAVVLTAPIWGSVVTAALGAVLSVVLGIFGVIVGLFAAAIGLFVAAVAVFVISVAKIVASPLASVFCIGLSVFMVGLAMLFLIAGWKVVTVLIPAIFKGLKYIFQSVFGKKEEVSA